MATLRKSRLILLLFAAVVLATVAGVTGGTGLAVAQGQVPPATNIEVGEGSQLGEMTISWDAVPQATYYRIGYVNLELDYHLAKASCTEEWIEAFIYVDVNAQNIPVNNGRAEYTVRRLSGSARHAFTVLTSNNFVDTGGGGSVSGEFFWPPVGSRWVKSLGGRESLPPGVTIPEPDCSAVVVRPGQVPPATNIEVGEGSQLGEMTISWDAVPQATYYRIGYVNLELDYHLAKASCTEEWIEAFIYVDVNAQNIPVNNGRAEYTVRRLSGSARHAFTVLTSNNFVDTGGGGSVSGEFFWPPVGSRWVKSLGGRESLPPGVTIPEPDCSAAPEITSPATDRAALVALYNATGGANWTDITNWLSTGPIGEWHGVTADASGRVTELNLRENNLTGIIPSGLGRLVSLERLDLQGNHLTGSIPGELSNLTGLQRVDLDYNQLTGALPPWLGNLGDLEALDLNDNRLTGEIPTALGNLANLELIQLRGNAFTGCIPASLQNVADNDLAQLALPFCGVSPTQAFTAAQLGTLFDEIIGKTEQREAFSEIKESNLGFSAIEDMKALRSEFIASTTETDLYYALLKLSNARRDRHLRIYPVDGGVQAPNRASCVSAPIQVLPDLSEIDNPTFFVAAVSEARSSLKVGDVIVSVNGRTMSEYANEFAPWIRHSSLPGLYWRMAYELPAQVATVPPSLYSGHLDLALENSSGQRYDVTLPYDRACGHFGLTAGYPGFVEVMRRENFNVLIDASREIILLQWLDFEDSLIQDIVDLMEFAGREQILDYDMIIDVTWSSGGSRGAYAIQRLVDQPFRVTFGNVRLSDLGKARIERYVNQEPDTDAPDIFGLNLSRSWLIDWARTDATEAIRRGDDYTPAVPFKLAHLPKDSDGILQPAPVRFSGEVAIINAWTWGGSHLDQFMAMFVDNGLATFIGVPTGGYSNTWEGDEVLNFAVTGRPVVMFQWSIGHTIRPNGEVLEGNPAQPHEYIPLTHDNFQGYHRMLLDRAIAELSR